MKSARELNELITVLFEILSEEKIKRFDETAKLKEEHGNSASLNKAIQVHSRDVFLGPDAGEPSPARRVYKRGCKTEGDVRCQRAGLQR